MTTSDRIHRVLLRIGFFEQRWLIWLCTLGVRAVRAVGGDSRAHVLWHRLGNMVVWSGWPFVSGWVSLHASRFYTTVEHGVWANPPVTRRPRADRSSRRLRVGMLAQFHYTLGAQRPLFEQIPDEIEVHLFDRSGGHGAVYLAPLVEGYHEFATDHPAAISDAINAAHLDVFLNMVSRPIAYRVFEQIDTPCVVHVGTGSDLMHHPRVDFHLFTQPEFGYGVRGGRVHCTFTDQPFGAVRAYESGLVCDARDLNAGPRKAWKEREPLIVWHGSLYKLGTGPFLEVVLELLEADRERRFEFFGKGNPQTLDAIRRRAEARGLTDRVIHRGVAGFVRDRHGQLQPDTFADLRDSLGRARFWPDSFPVGGGSARFEAYCAGVPSIHMAIATDDPDGPYEDGSLLELPWLRADGSVSRSRAEYVEMAGQCLDSEEFATRLVSAQDAVVARVIDAPAWWRSVVGHFEDWERQASR